MDGHRPALSGRWALLVGAPPLAFLVVFFAWPVLSILAVGIVGPEGVRIDRLVETWADRHTIDVVWFTLWQAVLSTVLTVLAALPAAFLFARYDFPGKRLLRAVITVPFVLPTVVVASAFLALLGPRSPINELAVGVLGFDAPPVRLDGSIWAILLAHVFYDYAVVVRLVGGVWSHIDPRTEEAARVLGAGRWRAFREVTLPLLRPAIASAASIVFLFTFTSFGVILLLGRPGTETLEVDIFRTTAQLLDLPAAAALAILQMTGVFVSLVLYARSQERLTVHQRLRPAVEVLRRPADRAARLLAGATVGSMLLLLATPLVVLVERSFATGGGYGLAAYESLLGAGPQSALFVPPVEAVGNSLAFAAGTTVLASVLGLLAAAAICYHRGWLSSGFDALLMLPLGTSAVTLGFGFIVALDEPPLDLRTSPLLIPLAHTLVAMPFVIRATVPLIRSIEPRLREAAAVLGASPGRVWREVDWPVIRRAALIGGGFAFAVSLGEFGATLFIARPDVPTVPVAIFRLLGQPGALNFAQAMAMSTILMLLTGGAVLLIERWRGDESALF